MQACVGNCGPNAIYYSPSRYCMCNQGYYDILGQCGQCPSNTKYDSWLRCCIGIIPPCKIN